MSDQTPQTAISEFPDDFTMDDVIASLTEAEVNALQNSPDGISLIETPAEVVAEQQPAPVVEQPTVTLTQIPDTSAAQATVAKLESEIEALADKYDEGELTKAEWLAQQAVLVNQQAQAQAQIMQAATVAQGNQKTVLDQWYAELDAYKTKGNEALWSEAHVAGWDASLRAVSANPAYNTLPMGRQFELAHDFYAADYRARTGQVLETVAGRAGQQGFEAAKTPAKLAVNPNGREEAPITLASLNGDSNATLTDGTLAHLLRGNAEDAEAYFNSLTPAQQEAALMSA